MQWGSQGIADLQSHVTSTGTSHVLGFNEPDNGSQVSIPSAIVVLLLVLIAAGRPSPTFPPPPRPHVSS